ncbi:hypothetical protein PVK06_047925 [Gossypium arboreum]|uniref:Uncharacterized protein n=1 Tax=Gossypium arboreum TaxID=29729 RepID=A0ABR0MEP2_GOSAR|nr:hypothetical protein PVK06_047925 [Gossypium arboreum]
MCTSMVSNQNLAILVNTVVNTRNKTLDNTLDLGKHSAVSFNKNVYYIQQANLVLRSVEFLDLVLGSKLKGPKDRRSEGRDSDSQSNRRTYLALRGRGNHFKSSRNTRVPLAESMAAMAEFLSPKILNENLNVEIDDVGSKLDCNIRLES